MTCEYCNQLWNDGHDCVGSDLARQLAKRDAEIERLRACLQMCYADNMSMNKNGEKILADNARLREENARYIREIIDPLNERVKAMREALEPLAGRYDDAVRHKAAEGAIMVEISLLKSARAALKGNG